jgi:hypothetical protein
MDRSDPLPTARALVAELFPHAEAAWLGRGAIDRPTPTSDLDVTVLLAGEVLDRAGGPLWAGYRAGGEGS